MARRPTPPTPQSANLSYDDMRAAIPKLKRRVEELKAVDVGTIRVRSEPRFTALEQKIDSTLVEIFGAESIEYEKFKHNGLDRASVNYLYETPLHEVVAGYKVGIERAVSNLQTIIDLFEERLQDAGESPRSRAVRSIQDADLHPDVARAVMKRFHDGHYADAVEAACKVLDALVKMRSGRDDLSGKDLMQTVFSPNSPILRFSDLQTETEKSEQQGMMFLYAGAVLALRNPRAHELIEDHPEQALSYISFLSMLANALDRTKD